MNRILIAGAMITSMDPAVGDLRGDILVEDGLLTGRHVFLEPGVQACPDSANWSGE